jgi:hypothetical protein
MDSYCELSGLCHVSFEDSTAASFDGDTEQLAPVTCLLELSRPTNFSSYSLPFLVVDILEMATNNNLLHVQSPHIYSMLERACRV